MDYISSEEKEKCKIVAEAFKGLLNEERDCIIYTEKYGYVLLKGFSANQNGFDEAMTFPTAEDFFKEVLDEWYCEYLYKYSRKSAKEYTGYSDIYANLPEGEKEYLSKKKKELAAAAGMPESMVL